VELRSGSVVLLCTRLHQQSTAVARLAAEVAQGRYVHDSLYEAGKGALSALAEQAATQIHLGLAATADQSYPRRSQSDYSRTDRLRSSRLIQSAGSSRIPARQRRCGPFRRPFMGPSRPHLSLDAVPDDPDSGR
jgi:hypothetical protein